jgi:hypothetical protein
MEVPDCTTEVSADGANGKIEVRAPWLANENTAVDDPGASADNAATR